jgi:hypothetical protein
VAPKRRGPTPVSLGQGLATWLVYLSVKRLVKPVRWGLSQIRRAIFHWTDYTRYLREQSVIEGVFNGRKLWLVVGGGVWGVRALRKATGGTERIVLREVIQPGDRIVISQLPRKASRKQRRATAKAS